VIEVTGAIQFGAEVVLKTSGWHVVMMNAELDGTPVRY
jgi:predicted homoserine dehydrogenase-like protein